MKYIILANSRKKQGEMVALVNRKRFKDQWWTENIRRAVVFTSKEQAQIQCSKLKFNNPRVYRFEKGAIRLGQVERTIQTNSIANALERKMHEWHDDDWNEGMGGSGVGSEV